MQRRLIIALGAAVLIAAGLLILPPALETDQAVSAAINVAWGTDPPAQTGASCHFSPTVGVVLLRYRYSCELESCGKPSGLRFTILRNLASGRWRYEYPPGDRPTGGSRTGETRPEHGATPTKCDPSIEGP